MKQVVMLVVLLVTGSAKAEFILPSNVSDHFIIGATEEISELKDQMFALTGSDTFTHVCDTRLWPEGPYCLQHDCAWEVDPVEDCTVSFAWYYEAEPSVAALLANYTWVTQAELPQHCLDRLALQYCGYNPAIDWPIACMIDGICCVD